MLSTIESIYAAVETPALWDPALRQIGDLLGGESIALFAGAPNAQTPHLLSMSEMNPDAWQDFVAYYAAINPIMQRCEERLNPAATWFGHAVLTDAELENSEFYASFFRPNGMHHSVGMRLEAEGLPSASLSCQRSKAAGQFGSAADVILQTLRPHLLRALSLRMHLGAMHARNQGLESALDAYHHAVVGIDTHGRIALCNSHAKTILCGSFGISIRNERLLCKDPAADAALQSLIHAAADPGSSSLPRSAAIGQQRFGAEARASTRRSERTIPRTSLLLHCLKTHVELRVTVLPYRRSLPGQSGALGALIFLAHSSEHTGTRAASLIDLYSLTASEARVADLLAKGYDVKEIAGHLHLTLETARFYLKSILAKTNTRRQVDLLRLVLSIPAQ